jgi:hypothetical protein
LELILLLLMAIGRAAAAAGQCVLLHLQQKEVTYLTAFTTPAAVHRQHTKTRRLDYRYDRWE